MHRVRCAKKNDFSPAGGRKNRMSKLKQISKLVSQNPSKILMLVMDGLGGLPVGTNETNDTSGKTELETAHTPNFDKLAADGICGLHLPVGTGIIPGSGPAHLWLFGYDPLQF